jgi:hypothetical protein
MLLRTSLTALACAASLAVAAPASADSISYVKDGNVFLTTPDGSRTFQVTSSGAYSYASQADDGTIVALAGESLHKLDRYGNVLADFKTPVSDGPPPAGDPNWDDASANYFHGPFDPQISPDGTKIAYSYYWQHYTFDPTCGSGGCMRQRLDSGTALTHADRLTGWDELGGHLSGWIHPDWISNDELLRSEAGVVLSENAVVDKLGSGELNRWFRFGFYAQYRDMALTRQKDKLAFVTEQGDFNGTRWYLQVWRTPAGTDAPPEQGCFEWLPDDGSDPESPSWSPDGGTLAFADGQGIHSMPVPDQSGGCKSPENEGKIVAPAGSSAPDFGPADVPTERPRPADPAPAPAASPARPQTVAPSVTLGGAPGGSSLRASSARRAGRVVTVRAAAPGPGRVTAVARSGGKVVARGGAVAKRAGDVVLRLRLTKAGARRRGALKVALAFTPKGGGAVQRASVRVRTGR